MQENYVKGGLRGVGRDEFGRPRCMKSRAANGIDQDTKLNKPLWIIGDENDRDETVRIGYEVGARQWFPPFLVRKRIAYFA